MRTLVLCDDYWHPARTPRAGLGPLEHSGFEFDWVEHAGEWSAARMAEYPLVVLTKACNMRPGFSLGSEPRRGYPLELKGARHRAASSCRCGTTTRWRIWMRRFERRTPTCEMWWC